jgi:hypothetical protein
MRIGFSVLGLIGCGILYACGSTNGSATGSAGSGGAQAGSASAGVGGDLGGSSSPSSGAGGVQSGAGTGNGAGMDASGTAGSVGAGGAAGSAETAGEAGAADTVPVIANLIDLTQTHFLDYGKLHVAFKQAVDASSLNLTLLPASPSALHVTSLTRVDDMSVDATLAFYHLPIDYELDVLGQLADATPFQTSATLSGSNNGSRVAFLTKQLGSGKMSTWAEASASASTPIAAADSVCQFEANAAGFKGKFAALLSAHGSYDATCRALGLTGLVANKCGQAAMPSDSAPWLSPLGFPIVNGADNIATDNFETPFARFADGTLGTQVSVWTGSEPGAIANTSTGGTSVDCDGWSDTTSYGITNTFSSDYLLEYARADSTCDAAQNMICVQVGASFFGPSTLHEVSGKRAFVSKGAVAGSAGLGAADLLCQGEAASAGYANASNFYAYLGTAANDALCHVLGGSGRVTDQCGLAALPTAVWRRADNYPIASAAALFGAGALLAAPISMSADQSESLDQRPWTGTSSTGVVATSTTDGNCGDWSLSSGTAEVGTPRCTTGSWQLFSSAACSSEAPVYCFER